MFALSIGGEAPWECRGGEGTTRSFPAKIAGPGRQINSNGAISAFALK
jgi:hypothetical protein